MFKRVKILVVAGGALVLLSASVVAAEGVIYSLTLGYEGTTLTHESIELIAGQVETRSLAKELRPFTAEMVSGEGKVLFTTQFLFSAERMMAPPTGEDVGGGETMSERTYKTIMLPYLPEAQSIDIYRDGVLRLSVDVTAYAPVVEEETEPPVERRGSGLAGVVVLVGLVVLGAAGWFGYRKRDVLVNWLARFKRSQGEEKKEEKGGEEEQEK